MNQELNHDDERFVSQAKQVLNRAVDDLDSSTTLRLQRARGTALEGSSARLRWAAWASGLAMASVAALAVVLWMKEPVREHHPVHVIEEMDLILSPENVELAEDLEFYHWLADADTTG